MDLLSEDWETPLGQSILDTKGFEKLQSTFQENSNFLSLATTMTIVFRMNPQSNSFVDIFDGKSYRIPPNKTRQNILIKHYKKYVKDFELPDIKQFVEEYLNRAWNLGKNEASKPEAPQGKKFTVKNVLSKEWLESDDIIEIRHELNRQIMKVILEHIQKAEPLPPLVEIGPLVPENVPGKLEKQETSEEKTKPSPKEAQSGGEKSKELGESEPLKPSPPAPNPEEAKKKSLETAPIPPKPKGQDSGTTAAELSMKKILQAVAKNPVGKKPVEPNPEEKSLELTQENSKDTDIDIEQTVDSIINKANEISPTPQGSQEPVPPHEVEMKSVADLKPEKGVGDEEDMEEDDSNKTYFHQQNIIETTPAISKVTSANIRKLCSYADILDNSSYILYNRDYHKLLRRCAALVQLREGKKSEIVYMGVDGNGPYLYTPYYGKLRNVTHLNKRERQRMESPHMMQESTSISKKRKFYETK